MISLDALRASRQGADITLRVRDPDHLVPKICGELGWRLRSSSKQIATSPISNGPDILEYSIYPSIVNDTVSERFELLIAALVKNGVGLHGMQRCSATLEAVFAELTDRGQASSP